MDKESYSWGGIGFLALFFLIVVAFLFNRNGCGNGWFGNGGCGCGNWGGWGNGFVGVGVPGYGLGFEDYKAICQSEKQEIINSARTQYLVEEQANLTRANDTANANMLATKIDFYAYQGLRDKLAEEQRKNLVLENQLYNDRKFGEVDKQLSAISCQMLRRPDVTGIGAVSPNAAILNGLGINNLSGLGCGCGCGCNGNVLA